MAPTAEETLSTNAAFSNLPDGEWTPETVLSTLPPHSRPQPNTSPLPFMHLLSRLKTTPREGWRRFNIHHGESIADHMYRMSIITLLCPPSLAAKLDLNRCTRMALVHDMAEALVGDITPVDGVSKSEKSRREAGTMDYLCFSLLGGVAGGKEQGELISSLWQEYEDSVTPESHFVHDVDKMELLLQMVEYERSHEPVGKLDLGEFTRVATKIVMPEVQQWAREVLEERRVYWEGVGKVPKGLLSMGESHDGAEHKEDGVSEERRKQQDQYYGSVNGNGTSGRLNGAGATGIDGKRLA
ncbi:hypothetical protein LTR62_004788 [Meristemomyces frigidus]|uniref:5'-deoxynucleotidase n=1 Tax=Meristemomyces frigidus TaxID=1508187 RepID=A0AAN7YFW6_9PEZI|nr:hypothetical protein LTR62_004788 [Meristemomyces frigidus]